jgi:hypothetical protein
VTPSSCDPASTSYVWSPPAKTYDEAKRSLRKAISQLSDEYGSPLGRQGPPPALTAMGNTGVDWFLFTHDILSRRSSSPTSSAGLLCPLCAAGTLSRDHIVFECVATEVNRERQIIKDTSRRAWEWIIYPPHSLTSPWASSKASQRAARAASAFAAKMRSLCTETLHGSISARRGPYRLLQSATPKSVPFPLGPYVTPRAHKPPSGINAPDGPRSAPVIYDTWSADAIEASLRNAPRKTKLVNNNETSDCLLSALLALLHSTSVAPPHDHSAAMRRSLASAEIPLRDLWALEGDARISTTARLEATKETLLDPNAPTGPRELTFACAWLGVRVEVLRFSPHSIYPSVSTFPPNNISHMADGTPLIFAGSLAMWWPDPTSTVGHWEAFTGNLTTPVPPSMPPPVPHTPQPRHADPASGSALPELNISRPTVINIPNRTNVSQGPPCVTDASSCGPHTTGKRSQTL